jgi:multidrug efflux pump subunit AcrB
MLNSSTTFDPAFWLDHKSGNHYFVGVTYKEKDIDSLTALGMVPVSGMDTNSPVQLQNLVSEPTVEESAVEVNHLALGRVVNVYASADGRDIGSVARDVERVLSEWGARTDPPAGTSSAVVSWAPLDPDNPGETLPGYAVRMRGEVSSMRESFQSLGFGMALAAILIYLIMVAQFRSFLDPFIIMFAVPLGIIGVLLVLWGTGTTLNVQSFMGVIFMIGIAVTNSILLVEFANQLRKEQGLSAADAAIQSGAIRLRPILMTALAMVMGLMPLALHEGDPTMPLARAVIGGLTASTLLTIFVVPSLYVIFKEGRRATAN